MEQPPQQAGPADATPATWVLLRGLTREARHWNGFDQELQALLEERPSPARRHPAVLCLDLPGNGTLNALRSPASVPEIAEQCRARLRAGGIEPPYVLVAMSLGAMAALHWCHAAPHELAGAVLINTSLRGLSPFWQRLRPRNYPQVLRLLLAGSDLQRREAAILRMTSNDPRHHAQLPARWAEVAREHPVARANAMRQLMAAARYVAPDQRPLPPMLVLASQRDGFVSVACSRTIAQRWHLPLRLHPEAGHDLPLDDPQWVLRQLREWGAGPLATSVI